MPAQSTLKYPSPAAFVEAWKVWHARIKEYHLVLPRDYTEVAHQYGYHSPKGVEIMTIAEQYWDCLMSKPMYGHLAIEHREEANCLVKAYLKNTKKSKVGCTTHSNEIEEN